MHAQKTNRGKKTTITCPNPACGATFQLPVKVLNLHQSTENEACPRCLTALPQAPTETSLTPEQPAPEVPQSQEMPVSETQKSASCPHYLGYLSQKPQGQQIPDLCLVCKDLVDCMLKK